MSTTAERTTDVSNDPNAHEVLKEAHYGSYRFPAEFAGFTADFTAAEGGKDGFTVVSGSLEVSDPRTIAVSGAEGDLAEFVKKEVGSMAGHRWGTPYEQGDGRWTLTIADESEHPLGRLITVHDDPFKSSYRVRDGRITQVNRSMGPMSFTISMQSHTPATDGKQLPETFTVTFWDGRSGRLTRSDIYTDRYESVGGVTLPAERRVLSAEDDGITGREIRLSNWKLRS